MEYLISVIIPVYNSDKYLKRCLDSVINQTYKNLEIIIVNDGSTDNSDEICVQYANEDSRIKYFKKENGGQSSARNLGIKNATGDFIGFIDSDDWVDKTMYEKLLNSIIENNADLSEIEYVKTYNENIVSTKKIKKKCFNDNAILEYFMKTSTVTSSYSICRCLISKDVMENIFFEEGTIHEDMIFKYLVLSNCKKMVTSNEILYYYFMYGESTTSGKLRKKDFQLYDVSKELMLITQKNTSKKVRWYGRVKYARAPFSLLCKVAFYGISEELVKDKITITKQLTKEVRKNFFTLIKSKIRFSRKICLILIAINYKILSKLLNRKNK